MADIVTTFRGDMKPLEQTVASVRKLLEHDVGGIQARLNQIFGTGGTGGSQPGLFGKHPELFGGAGGGRSGQRLGMDSIFTDEAADTLAMLSGKKPFELKTKPVPKGGLGMHGPLLPTPSEARDAAPRRAPPIVNPPAVKFLDRFMAELNPFNRNAGAAAGQMSAVAEGMLSLSSIIRPLSPALSNVAMSAGFAAFSMGALPAVLTGITTAVAGAVFALKAWGKQIGDWMKVTRDAGFTTDVWRDSTEDLTDIVRDFEAKAGVAALREFSEVMGRMPGLLNRTVQELPIKDMVSFSADVTSMFMDTAGQILSFMESDFVGASRGMNNFMVVWDALTFRTRQTPPDLVPSRRQGNFNFGSLDAQADRLQKGFATKSPEEDMLERIAKATEELNAEYKEGRQWQMAEWQRVILEGMTPGIQLLGP